MHARQWRTFPETVLLLHANIHANKRVISTFVGDADIDGKTAAQGAFSPPARIRYALKAMGIRDFGFVVSH